MGIVRARAPSDRRHGDEGEAASMRSRPLRILWYFWRKGANDGVGMGWVDFAGGGTNLRQPRNREFDASRREPHLHLVPRRGRRKWESPRHRNYRTNPRVADDDSTRREILKERHVSTSVMPSASPRVSFPRKRESCVRENTQ